MNSRVLLLFALLAITATQPRLLAQSQAFLSTEEGTTAIDAKGVRHSGPPRQPGRLAPWLLDRVKAVAPDYPYSDRAQHHTGTGRFRLQLDLKTGAVTRIIITNSTGFRTLDNCALVALRQWRWKPGRWKEIEMPVTFRLERGPPQLPPGSVRLPKA
jgi:TonB family protein